MSGILDGLNEPQLIAVRDTLHQSALVLAGAGSGKTRVLTHRIAYLLEQGISPHSIMAITFTNKAAREMQERIANLIGEENAKKLTMGTFHKICIQMLKRYGDRIGLDKGFTIADPSDQTQAMRQTLAMHHLDTSAQEIRNYLSQVSNLKNKGWTPEQYHREGMQGYYPQQELMLYHVYRDYQGLLKKYNMLDFDDLLMYAVKLLQQSKEVREYYQKRFAYIMVDEYQDTNPCQYQLIRLIAGKEQPEKETPNNVFVVGDDWQCWDADSLVRTKQGVKMIRDLQIGDEVLTIRRNQTIFSVVTNKSKPMYKEVLKIRTKQGYSLRVTPEHKCFATMPVFGEGYAYVYMMYRADKGYRIGVAQGGLEGAIGARTHPEKPDRLWILGQYSTLQEAYYYETKWSLEYQIPTIPYFHNGRGLRITQQEMDKIFQQFGLNGERLLEHLGYHFDYPHYVPQGTTRYGTTRKNVNITMNGYKGIEVSLEYAGVRIRRQFSEYKKAVEFAKQLFIEHDADVIREKYSFKDRKSLLVIPASQLFPTMKIPIVQGNTVVLDEVVSIESIGIKEVYDVEVAKTGILVVNDVVSHNCIYAFRGSDISIILRFEQDFPEAKVIKLEENYRSTKAIVHVGNGLIKHNQCQKQKTLYTKNENGEKVKVYEGFRSEDEVRFVVQEIQNLVAFAGYDYKDIAVLYRTNFLSREIETQLVNQRIPYRIIGGVGFYDRMEIKDTIAYLKVIANPKDDIAMERILSITPGVGKSTIQTMKQNAEIMNMPLSEVFKQFNPSRKSIQDAFDSLRQLLQELYLIYQVSKTEKRSDPVTKMMEIVWKRTRYKEKLQEKHSKENLSRLQNLQELFQVAKSYENSTDNPTLEDFLDSITLQVNEEQDVGNSVSLMTVHASKGLEFPAVFVIGMNEEIFPHKNSLLDEGGLEEERRLAYVAITRAKKLLYLTYCKLRGTYHTDGWMAASRFIEELPQEAIQYVS